MEKRAVTDLDRVHARTVRRGACLLWTGPTNRGYGQITLGGRKFKVHRLVFELVHGEAPPVVMHTCDTPGCADWQHLAGGTQADNLADMRRKGRNNDPFGESHPSAKLTDREVSAIRALYARGHSSLRAIGRRYGVGHRQVSLIVNYESRKA